MFLTPLTHWPGGPVHVGGWVTLASHGKTPVADRCTTVAGSYPSGGEPDLFKVNSLRVRQAQLAI
jgi:hypothetical protein